ncbi:MAG: NADH-quinone oxidoreductase subunit C [Acidimicrobiales bacterium]
MSDAAAAPASEAAPAPAPAPEAADLHGAPLVHAFGVAVVHTGVEGYLPLMRALRDDGYDLFVGLTGVDYLTHPGRDLPPGATAERFEVVVELASIRRHARLRVRCQVPGEQPEVPTLFEVWPGSEAHERETYDMFGVRFAGHPDPTRILMPEDWEGHPLRKDYATGHVPVQFKESPGGR